MIRGEPEKNLEEPAVTGASRYHHTIMGASSSFMTFAAQQRGDSCDYQLWQGNTAGRQLYSTQIVLESSNQHAQASGYAILPVLQGHHVFALI